MMLFLWYQGSEMVIGVLPWDVVVGLGQGELNDHKVEFPLRNVVWKVSGREASKFTLPESVASVKMHLLILVFCMCQFFFYNKHILF